MKEASMDMVLPLVAQDAALAAVGGKGANLAKLAAAGLLGRALLLAWV